MNMTSGGEASSLPWNWVMESLAGVEDIDTAVLENLVKIVPRGYESLDPSAKERLALRRLLELFAETNDKDATNVSSTSGIFVIDVAESAQDVYDRLSKMQTSNLPDSVKLDIRQFAIQKKSHLPKCQLQQLEEALRDHGETSNEILREVLCVRLGRSKDHLNNGTEIQTPDVNHTCSISGNQENCLQEDFRAEPSNMSGKDETVQVLENSVPVPSVQDVANTSKQCRNVGEPQSVNEISSTSAPKNLNGRVRVDHANDHLVTGKRKRCDFEKDPILDSMDNGKQNEMEHSSDQVFVPEALNSSHGKSISSIQSEAAAAEVPGIDGCEHTPKRSRALADSPQTEDQEVTMEDAGDKVQVPNTVKLPDNSRASILYSQEDITAIQSTLMAQDSVEAEWTEENLCMKCNKCDQLLVCCGETCPVIVHERCLGSSSANFDTMGKFYCPLCSYSQALATYHEAKEKAKRAKKKAELMRDRLDEFLNLKNDPKKRKEIDTEAPKDTGNDHVDAEALGNEEPRLEPPPVNAPQTSENQQSLESRRVITPPESSGHPPVRIPPESLDGPLVTNAPQVIEAMENGESSHCPLGNQAQESDAKASKQCNSVNERQRALSIAKEPLVRLNVDAQKGSSHHLEEIVESHSAGTKTTLTDQDVADVDVAAARDFQRESTSSDQISEDVSVSAQGNCDRSFIFRKRKTKTHPPLRQIITKTRRVKTKWTEAEVAMLEEGMKRYMNSATKWNDILEFGGRVFHPCRLGGDLKDKWRNMHR